MKNKIVVMLTLLVVFALYVSMVSAQEELYQYEDLTLNLTLSSKLTAQIQSGGFLEYVKADLAFYPESDYRQTVLTEKTTPQAQKKDTGVSYYWQNPQEKSFPFQLETTLKTQSTYIKVKQKIHFPLTNLPSDVQPYLKETEFVDFKDPAIVQKANELAAGEDDLFKVAYKTAVWVNTNITYDLNTVTADASQKASWVMKNRQGVCDELTNLYIAMLRSLGIPARFVTGISYTTSELFTTNWGPHGWAEVYFPGYGWVPFDVTYNQLGFVDATHIKVKDAPDADKTSLTYEWEGNGVTLQGEDLNINVDVLQKGKVSIPPYTLNAVLKNEHVGFGSYDLLEITITNNADYYIPLTVFLSESEGLTIPEGYIKQALLLPKQQTKLYWTIKVDDDLQKAYEYQFLMKIYTITNQEAEVSIIATSDAKVYSKEEIETNKNQKEKEEEKVYSKEISLSCSTEKKRYRYEEEPKITCTIQNNGNAPQQHISVCAVSQSCSLVDLTIAEQKDLEFTLTNKTIGMNDITIIAENDGLTKSAEVQVELYDDPHIEINDIQMPSQVAKDEEVTLNFTVDKTSFANPKDVILTIDQELETQTMEYAEFKNDQPLSVNIDTSLFVHKVNPIVVQVTYKDEKGKVYQESETITLELTDLTFIDQVERFIWGLLN